MTRQILRSIILPAYNESGFIAEMIDNTITACQMKSDPFEIIVIDNASEDATATIVDEIAQKEPRVRLIRHLENHLYAGSCLSGIRASRGDRIFILDSDGQHPPQDIWKFDVQLDHGSDIVFGWRKKRSETTFRILMSRCLLFLSKLYLGYPLHDINCGIRGFNRVFADKLSIEFRVNFVNPELYVRSRIGGFKIGEVVVAQEKRRAGKTSHILHHPWKIFRNTTCYLKDLRDIMNHELQTD